jgi:hypothetical protein
MIRVADATAVPLAAAGCGPRPAHCRLDHGFFLSIQGYSLF